MLAFEFAFPDFVHEHGAHDGDVGGPRLVR